MEVMRPPMETFPFLEQTGPTFHNAGRANQLESRLPAKKKRNSKNCDNQPTGYTKNKRDNPDSARPSGILIEDNGEWSLRKQRTKR